jgi:hypothetical protein
LQRILIFKRDETARALTILEEKSIGANADPEYGAGGVIWIHENSDLRPALKFLREQNILATEYPV